MMYKSILFIGKGKTLKCIKTLLKDIQRGYFDGIGKPEPLKGVNLTAFRADGLMVRIVSI